MPDTGALSDSIVLVTGASTGIGRAIALAAAGAGADVAITYHTGLHEAQDVARAVERLGRRSAVFQLDLASPSSIGAMGTSMRQEFGRVDAWINNAGADILTGEGSKESDMAKLDRLLTIDLRGTILASWEAARVMLEQPTGGVIVNMSWDHVLSGMSGRNPEMFSAAKGGILSFSKSLARSVAPKVRVNILAPGWIATEFAAGMPAERSREVVESTPLRRWGTPEDVARAAVFLASRDTSFVTGQMLLIGGGTVM